MTDKVHNFGDLARVFRDGAKPPAGPPRPPPQPSHGPAGADHHRDDGRRAELASQKNNLEYAVAQLKRELAQLRIDKGREEHALVGTLQRLGQAQGKIEELSQLLEISPDALAAVARDRAFIAEEKQRLDSERADLEELQRLLNEEMASAKEAAAKILDDARDRRARAERECDEARERVEKEVSDHRREALRGIKALERQSKTKVEDAREAVYQREMRVAAREKKLEAWTRKITRLERENLRLRAELAEMLTRTGQKRAADKLLDHEDWPKAVDRAIAMAKPKMGAEMKWAVDQLKSELAGFESEFIGMRNAAKELESLCRILSGIEASSGPSSAQIFLGMLTPLMRNNAPLCRRILGPRVVTCGSIPLLPKALETLLGVCCVEVVTATADAECAVWIVGRSGWREDDLDGLLSKRAGRELRVFSHELLLASLVAGGDVYTLCDPDDTYALGADHPALTYLYEKGFEWPRAVVPRGES